MGVLIKLIDAVLLYFFLVVILAAPAFDAQVCFPSKFFPNFLVDLNLWFTSEYAFFLCWAYVARASLPVATCHCKSLSYSRGREALVQFSLPSLWSLCFYWNAELILSSRITNVLMMIYLPFLGFAILAILRGLLPCSRQTKMNARVPALGRKKRA
ncbi:hypothetical protein HYC85_011325 [Camellia sinensis]|uniref:EXPERA domain-containing protein n=1 Tax=Camellia sinensis TaxID=4442 RepID=A0A7J7H8R6_CAMSI|nr:hypothetical protein HYC85_011325 [Camellia sinensis]